MKMIPILLSPAALPSEHQPARASQVRGDMLSDAPDLSIGKLSKGIPFEHSDCETPGWQI